MADNEEATQPATQLVVDPRRLGHQNSGLNDDDLVDIICILHPASLSAIQATAHIAQESPQHTVHNDRSQIQYEGDRGHIVSRDIALRLSAKLKNPLAGFQFGRNAQRCDIVVGAHGSSAKRVSNVHFRVYIHEFGSIMLEDQSTNGTKVDDKLLRAKDKENCPHKHTLENGSVITFVMTPPEEDIRFIVRIPQRDFEHEEEYNRKLTEWFFAIKNGQKLPTNGRAANAIPPNIFDQTSYHQSLTGSRHIREWRGGPKYNKIGCIGKGAFASVYQLTAKFDGHPFAAKELEKRRFMKNGVLDQKVETEMKIMSRIKHPHIVQYIEHVDWDEYLYIIMDFIPGGDLGKLIDEKDRLPELAVKSMAIQLLDVLHYLHGKGITHRDIKPDNILIQSREPFHVKLTDFGLSKMVEGEDTFLRTFCGTLLYCAPEVYSEYREYNRDGVRQYRGKDGLGPQRYGHAVDVWSLGAVLFYCLAGSPPYPASSGTTYQELLSNIMTKPLDIRPLQNAKVSEQCIRFIKSMLKVRPDERATIDELKESSWLHTPVSGVNISVEDEFDVIDEELELGASQLSLQADSDAETQQPTVTAQNWQPRDTIPSSFETGEASTEFESFSFPSAIVVEAGKPTSRTPRLWGEVNYSALGSSGVITQEDRMNLPASDKDDSMSEPESESGSSILKISSDPQPLVGVDLDCVQPQRNVSEPAQVTRSLLPSDADNTGPLTDPSLLGAESLVAQMQVHSPGTRFPSVATTAHNFDGFNMSQRRPHPDSSGEHEPATKKAKSSRQINVPVSKSIFWDTDDKSTWHNDYPNITLTEFQELEGQAKAQGERFIRGEKTFDMLLQSYRESHSPSAQPESQSRARSEPLNGIERRDTSLAPTDPQDGRRRSDTDQPSSSGNSEDTKTTSGTEVAPSTNVLTHNVQAAFKPPKQLVARLISTEDSVISNLSIQIFDQLTSWGRGSLNTLVYGNAYETRIPKYAFKIFIWDTQPFMNDKVDFNEPQQDYAFWISTKSTQGIHVNDVHIPSDDCKRICMPSKHWGQLRHGDRIQIWTGNGKNMSFTFECFWGASQHPRKPGEVFELINERAATKIDRQCYEWEKEFLDERDRQKERAKNQAVVAH